MTHGTRAKQGRHYLIRLLKDKRILLALLVIGLFLAEAFLSQWTALGYDMKIWFNTGAWMKQGTNIYLPEDHLGYPPLWAFWCQFSYGVYETAGNNMEVWRFTTKLPLILAQFALAFAMAKFAEQRFDKKTAQKIFFLALTWVFFIYIAAFWGQLNMLSALLTFLAFWAVISKRTVAGAILLGVAVTLKIYPLITLPAFLIYTLKNRDKKEAGKFLLFTLAVPVVFTLGVFAVYQWDILLFLKTIFYWTPAFEANPVLLQGGGMNFWSFMSLANVDISQVWFLRFIWVPVLAAAVLYWFRRPKMDEADLNLSLISLYLLFLVSYGFVPEQAFLDPLPFIFLQILGYRAKRLHFYALVAVQALVFAFSTFNWGPFIFEPLLTQFSPSLANAIQVLDPSKSPLVWTARGIMGLVVSLSLTAFLVLLARPDLLRGIRERVSQRLSSVTSER